VNVFFNNLGSKFEVNEIDRKEKLVSSLEDVPSNNVKNKKSFVFGLYDNVKKRGHLLRLKDPQILTAYFPNKSKIYSQLDVNIVHKLIIEDMLGITEQIQMQGNKIKYIKGNQESLELLNSNTYQLGIFLNPPLIEEVFQIAKAKETMPQKATYFFPKVWTGFVCYPLYS